MTQYFEVDAQLYDDQKGKEECQGDPDYSYQKCVDDQIESGLLAKLGCLPPYLSDKNQCTTVLKDNTTSDYVFYNYLAPYYYFMKSKVQKTCQTPCQYQIYTVTEGEQTHYFGNDSWINVGFNQKVKKFTKLPNYDFFRYNIVFLMFNKFYRP